MCSPVRGLTAKPAVSFFTSSLDFAASFGLASSLGLPSPLAVESSDVEESCATAGTEARNKVRQTDRTITNQLRRRNLRTSRFTVPSLDPDLPERPRGRTEMNSITATLQDKNNS